MNSIGIDIGGSHITSCMYEHNNRQIIRTSLVYKKVNTQGSKEDILHTWVEAIKQTIANAKIPFKGIGFAMPGPFDYFNGVSLIKGVDKLDALYELNLRNELARRLMIEPSKIRFINDATAFSIAEALIGKASQYKKVVAITLGTGLGASFLIDAKPIVDGGLVPEGGFLYNHYHNGELADDVFSTRGIVSSYKNKAGRVIRNVRELCDLIPQDNVATEILNAFGSELGKYLKPYLDNFGAECLVIGGNISKAYPFFFKYLEAEIPNLEIYVSNLGEEAAVIGGALLANDAYYQKLEDTLKKM